jgi:hypothetical protein
MDSEYDLNSLVGWNATIQLLPNHNRSTPVNTLQLKLDDELSAAFAQVCAKKGHDKESLATQLVRQYVNREELKQALVNPDLSKLYQELQEEDQALANQGMLEYSQLLREADLL